MKRIITALCILIVAGSAYAYSGTEHASEQLADIWGFSRETLLQVNRIIDTLPGRNFSGGWGHRASWGHSDSWFNQNWETIAAPFKSECPALTKPKLKALSQRAWDIHMKGDMTTSAGVSDVNINALNARLKEYNRELIESCNEAALNKAIQNGTGISEFVSQPANIERIQAEYFIRRGFNLRRLGRNNTMIISPGGDEHIIAMKKSINDLKSDMLRFPEHKFAMTPEDFSRLSQREPELAKRAVTFASLGDNRGKADIINDAVKLCEERRDDIQTFSKNRIAEVRTSAKKNLASSKLRSIAPYAMFGAITALSENWDLIKDAYDNKAEWFQALARTGLDFTGYTVTPVMIDGILASSGKRLTLMTSLKNAGMGYTLGFFCWNAGREFCSWQSGNISRDEFMSRLRHNAAREIELLPVNVMAYVIAGAGYTFFVPVVIIGGNFAVQRVHEWYESKRWKNCIYTDDLRDILGDDLMNAFTIAEPEMRYNIAEPERRFNIAEPEQRRNIAEP